MINSSVYSNFNNCLLVWHFCSCKSLQKIEKNQKCCLRVVLNGCVSDDGNLIKKNGTTTDMENERLRTLATELFKTLISINP